MNARARPRAAALLVAGVAGAAALAGCGDTSADLFAVTRSPVAGAAGGATVVVRDDGTVACGRRRMSLPSALLLQARELQRELEGPATKGVTLAAGARPVYGYSVRSPAGSVRFYDDSARQPQVFYRLAYFTLQVLQQVCAAQG
jgi:hypothetical protein